MRIAPIALALTATLLLTACADSDEDIPTDAPTASPANAVVFCPRFGDGSTPTTPTPEPSCDPGDIAPRVGIADGVFSSKGTPPPLPAGATQLSNYFEFDGVEGIAGLTLPVPLRVDTGDQSVYTTTPDGAVAYWYTYAAGGWTRLNQPTIEDNSDTLLARSTFNPLPANLIVLAEPQ